MSKQIDLKGRIFLTFDIRAVTGLHIGGSETGIEIGGVDKTVIRDKLTNRPYIPGSSLKGKMRSLLEKHLTCPQNQRIGQGYIHSCEDEKEYGKCNVCQVFGVPGERTFSTPTRLVVRDTLLSDESVEDLEKRARTDLPYTEVKTEVSIDRVTSAANPRQMERVPAGVKFTNAELVYSIYNGSNGVNASAEADIKRLSTIVDGLQLLEDDYLGGSGSRGSGKVALENIRVSVRDRSLGKAEVIDSYKDLDSLKTALKDQSLQGEIRKRLGIS